LAIELGCAEHDVQSIELAARLFALELVEAGELRDVGSLREVDDIMRWARRGDADAAAMPIAAQVVAAANAFDVLTMAPAAERLSRTAAIAALRGDRNRYRAEELTALTAVTLRPASLRRDRRRRAAAASAAAVILPGAEGAA
jgi:hypothetical protein